ncbi:MAG: hypothetical protein QOD06_1928 [Candidatus Binatota bacterium]|nr:hypothetical protein [Candidatus Binatota bacterium]
MSRTRRVLSVLLVVVLVPLALLWYFFGGRQRLEDRTTAPLLGKAALERVADLDYPPGNVAVSGDGRVFFTYHPQASPPVQLAELVGGKPVPYPSAEFQKKDPLRFQSALAVRIDRQNRLWVLDHAHLGWGQPRILAFDLATGKLVHHYDFPREVARFPSMLNDFQVDPEGKTIYISESSPLLQTPALVVYDSVGQRSRRLLHSHRSVDPKPFIINAQGRDMVILGFFAFKIGVDSIALDQRGEWLYYGALSGDRMYRIRTRDLNDPSLGPYALAARVEDYALKPLSDGLSIDVRDNVYVTDVEQSAILSLGPDRGLKTLVKDDRLRWPDGLGFGPDGWLYVTCSALHQVIFQNQDTVRSHAPYQIFRFKPGVEGVPGH